MDDSVVVSHPAAPAHPERKPDPNTLVIFGATGDLTHRKLMPALYNLARANLLPPGFSVIAFARRPYSDDRFRQEMLDAVNRFSRTSPVQQDIWNRFAQGIFYLQSDFSDPEGYQRLAHLLARGGGSREPAATASFILPLPPTRTRRSSGGWAKRV